LSRGLKFLDENPAFKEKVKDEIAQALKGGYETLAKQYPLFKSLTPFKSIMQTEQGRKAQAQSVLKKLEKEQKGIYNVAFNGKNATLIKKDLEAVEEAILFEKGTKRKGGKHIRLAHSTEPSQEGYVTKQEVANLGVNIREYLKNYEPFIDKNKARLYEWKDENGVKFRVVVNDIQTSGGNSHLPSASEEIITFYSDRNLKEKMNFKNPALKKQKITDKAKMQEQRKKEGFYNVFSLQDVLSDDFIKKNKLGDTYYGSINIGEKLKQGEYNIISNQLYISKDDFDKNKISDEAINDFLLSLSILGDWEAKSQLYKAQRYAYQHKMPLNLAKENIIQEAELEKTIPLFKEAKEKFKEFEPRKIKDLLEWHKDSSLITKDENGLPNVFYHGSDSKHNVFEAQEDQTNLGFFFSTNPKEARAYGNKFYKVFLKIKNPFLADEVKIKNEKDLQKWADFLEIEYPKNAYNDFLEMKDYFDDIKARGQSIGLMLSESDSFYANFIDKSGKYINVNLTNLEKAPYKIQQAFKDFEHITDRDNGIGFKNSGANHNFLNWARNDFDLILMALDRENLKYGEYERLTQKSLKDLLKTKGYDGIKFNDCQYS
ncbi:hypothetical protein CHLV4139_09710, partial [Campylobacter helveticus]|uniref:ADP-ribosyltransferase-containing protein n=1 Tax=Campylobacter helveticus TaxID=28898 RepID=UPI003FA435F6|nr:hypothetical protein [Campylobacter helveticus]